MLENEQRLGGLPSALGTKFCGNGDLLGFVHTTTKRAGRHRGPVITSTMRVDDKVDPGAGTGRGFYLQDGGYPGFADWIVETTLPNPTCGVRSSWGRRCSPTASATTAPTTSAWRSASSSASSASAGLAADAGHGARRARRRDATRRRLARDRLERGELARVLLAVKQLMEQVARARRRVDREPDVVAEAGGHGASARRLPDGTHAELPPVGEQGAPGVVDDHGEVFGQRPVRGGRLGDAGPVGPNPSLTIAALAERFSRRMIERVDEDPAKTGGTRSVNR